MDIQGFFDPATFTVTYLENQSRRDHRSGA